MLDGHVDAQTVRFGSATSTDQTGPPRKTVFFGEPDESIDAFY